MNAPRHFFASETRSNTPLPPPDIPAVLCESTFVINARHVNVPSFWSYLRYSTTCHRRLVTCRQRSIILAPRITILAPTDTGYAPHMPSLTIDSFNELGTNHDIDQESYLNESSTASQTTEVVISHRPKQSRSEF